MKKLIFIIDEFLIGGVETSFINLYNYVLKDNYEIELHTYNPVDNTYIKYFKDLKLVNIKKTDIYSQSLKRNFFKYLKAGKWNIILKKLIIAVFLRIGINCESLLCNEAFPDKTIHKCDACIILKENQTTLFYALKRIKCNKLLCFFHTSSYFDSRFKSIYMSPKISQIITVSQGNKNFLLSKMHGIDDKIAVIHNVVPVSEIKDRAEQITNLSCFDNNSLNIVTVCRIHPEKGIDLIIEVARELSQRNFNYKWTVVGPFHSESIREHYLFMSANSNIEFVGFKNNPYPYIKNADVVVNCSKIESFGMVIRESQILHTPIIATTTFGGCELINNNIDGILIPVDDREALVQAILNFNKAVWVFDDKSYDEVELIAHQFSEIIEKGIQK